MGRSYRQLIRDWATVLPTQSVCLSVPLVLPSEYEDPRNRRQAAEARVLRTAELLREASHQQ